VFVPCKPFKPSLITVSVAKAYLSEVNFICFTLGRLLALPTNIWLDWNGLQTLTLLLIMNILKLQSLKVFFILSPDGVLFFLDIYTLGFKWVCLTLEKHYQANLILTNLCDCSLEHMWMLHLGWRDKTKLEGSTSLS
jgi:hypothetical protein